MQYVIVKRGILGVISRKSRILSEVHAVERMFIKMNMFNALNYSVTSSLRRNVKAEKNLA